MKTTNYFNTFLEVAEDCPVAIAQIPVLKGDSKTVATLQFEMIGHEPYKYTSDEVIFRIYALRNNIPKSDMKAEHEKFFSKGQACLRTSPLAKRYGWGFHFDEKGKVALYGIDSDEYKSFVKRKDLEHVKAMRTKKAAI
jgi:hypothetical protein